MLPFPWEDMLQVMFVSAPHPLNTYFKDDVVSECGGLLLVCVLLVKKPLFLAPATSGEEVNIVLFH